MSETPPNTLFRLLLLRKCAFWSDRAWLRRLAVLGLASHYGEVGQ